MKHIIGIWMFALLVVGCGGLGGDDKGDTIALVPTSDCMNYGYGYNGQCNYPYGQQSGFYQYPYNSTTGYYQYNQNGFCSCPSGSRPVYNSTMGLGCISDGYVNNSYNYQTYSWNYGSASWLNMQPSNYTSIIYPQTGNGCYQNVMTVCDTRVMNSCGSGGFCRSVGGASSVGLCTFNYY